MNYTSDLPAVEGYYWNHPLRHTTGSVVHVTEINGKMFVMMGDYPNPVEEFDGLWAGPLIEPSPEG
jgi:hypothetical protein